MTVWRSGLRTLRISVGISSIRGMLNRLIFFFLVCPLCAAPVSCTTARSTAPLPQRTGPLSGDEILLQGSWIVLRNEIAHVQTPDLRGRLHIYSGRSFRLDTDPETDGEIFRIDEASTPKRIDFDDGRNPLIQGIYVLHGDRLTLCTGAPGAPRPVTFRTSFFDRSILTVLVRKTAR